MKKLIPALLILVFSGQAAVPQAPLEGTTAAVSAPAAGGFEWRKESTNGSFELGEDLKFDIAWKFIVVGHATMAVESMQDVGGRQAYHIATAAKSSSFFDNFYRVRDTNESWIDSESLCTLKYASVNDENNRRKLETILFDQVDHKFTILESSKTGTIPAFVQDVLSSLFYLRTKELTVGKDIILDAHSGDLSWPLRVKVHRKETINVPAGRFECFVVEPGLREDAGIFQAKGKLLVWLTADSKKVPVLLRSQIVVGSVEAKLVSMKLK
jgi:hypothetical protein